MLFAVLVGVNITAFRGSSSRAVSISVLLVASVALTCVASLIVFLAAVNVHLRLGGHL
ncbi:hypothetical protein D3C83_58010 [compost metagenome]